MKTPRLSIVVAGFALAGLATTQAATYTWQSTSSTDWANAANWDTNGVPLDATPGGGLDGSMLIQFDGSVMPDTNLPVLEGRTGATQILPSLKLNSGGALRLEIDGNRLVYFDTTTGTPAGWVIGDGNMANGSVALTTFGDEMKLNRGKAHLQSFTINSDGAWTSETATYILQDGRYSAIFIIDGGAFTGTDLVGYSNNVFRFHLNGTAGIELSNGGSVALSGTVSKMTYTYAPAGETPVVEGNATIDIQDETSSFTALFGGDFIDLAAVQAEIGSMFISTTPGLGAHAEDNGDGTFTLTAVVPSVAVDFGLTVSETAGTFGLEWNSSPGSLYTIEVSGDLESWEDLETDVMAADPDTTTTYSLGTPAETERFYRVKLQP